MTIKTIEQLKAEMLVATESAMARIEERKQRLTLERQIKEAQDDNLQNTKAERELFTSATASLNAYAERASVAVKEAQFTTRTGSELKLNFFPTRRKHLVVNKLTSLMNSMVYTRDDVSKLVANELGLTEVDIEAYRNSLGRNDSFTPELGVIKGFKGNAEAYNSNLHMLAEKLDVFIPNADFTQAEFDTSYANSEVRALEDQEEARQAEQSWDQNNGHGLVVDMS